MFQQNKAQGSETICLRKSRKKKKKKRKIISATWYSKNSFYGNRTKGEISQTQSLVCQENKREGRSPFDLAY